MKLKLYLFLLLSICSVSINAERDYDIINKTGLPMYARWEFVGDYWRRDIPKGGNMGIRSWLLHKGWSDVHTKGAKVGDLWGHDPETGEELRITDKMLRQNGDTSFNLGETWGIAPDFYGSTGQSMYHNFVLTVIPKRNPADNNNWWPSFKIQKTDGGDLETVKKAFESVGNTIKEALNLYTHNVTNKSKN